jgi:class 3 adenylate cyclase/DNA-binding CsgD family transcriptional regulator
MAAHGTTTTTTILFTDIVESTELRTRLGEAAADRLFVEHQRQLGQVVARRGGRVVKTAGDGVMAAFGSATDAVNAAVDLQRHVATVTPDMCVRVGLAAGDVAWEEDDCFGLPVVTAARLQAAAGGSDIVISSIVRLLAGDRAGVSYEPLDALELKGLPQPVEAYAVSWSPPAGPDLATAGSAPPPLPLALAVRAAHPLVGRDDAVAAIRGAWADARRGPGRVVLIGGEAGAGKTRLAAEIAAEVHAAGACVLHGGCDSDLALPYQPWVQAVDQLLPVLRDSMPAELAALLAPLANLAAHAEWVNADSRRVSLDAGAERYRTYGAFAAVLSEGVRRWPAMVVLDDLHWAGTQTLALLRHVARSGLPPGVLVVGTFRDTGDEISEPLAGCLADLRRVDGVVRIRLTGLGSDAVERFVSDAVDGPLDASLHRLAVWLGQRSGGNPYYLGELWRHLAEAGVVVFDGRRWQVGQIETASVVPESIREVVGDRLSRLSDPARRFVELAALGGQRVDLQVVDEAAELPPDELDAAVGELLDAGLLVQVSGAALVYRFAHALVRDTVVASIAPHVRARLHRSLAESIEAVHQADRRPVLAELAAHYAAAGRPVDKIAYYGRRAAAQAIRAAAYDEAVAHLDNVLGVNPPPLERSAALLQLGASQLRQGAFDASCASCMEAFDIAVELGDAAAAADAAVGFESARMFPGMSGGPSADMLRTALDLLGDAPSLHRANVMASLGRALAFRGRSAEGTRLAEEALGLAKSLGDDGAVSWALRAITTSTPSVDRQLSAGTELAELSERLSDGWAMSYANAVLLRALFALGRLDDAAAVLERHRTTSTAGHFATFEFMTHAFDALFALAAGDLDGAEAAAERARAKGESDDSPYDAGVYGLQMYAIRRAQGRLAEVAPLMRLVTRVSDSPATWRPGLAALYGELDMVDDARAVFEELAADGFAAVPRDSIWPASLSFLAEACLALNDRSRADVLHGELTGFSGLNLLAGMTVCFGPADRLLGGLAALLDRPADADEHFRVALDLAERCRSPLWTAEVRYDWAVALARRDPHRARELGSQAIATAQAFGIGRLADRAVPGGGSVATGAVAELRNRLPDDLSEREAEVLRLIATGLSNQKIGAALFISQNTVANHVRAILRKTRCANRTEASLYAVREGIVTAG